MTINPESYDTQGPFQPGRFYRFPDGTAVLACRGHLREWPIGRRWVVHPDGQIFLTRDSEGPVFPPRSLDFPPGEARQCNQSESVELLGLLVGRRSELEQAVMAELKGLALEEEFPQPPWDGTALLRLETIIESQRLHSRPIIEFSEGHAWSVELEDGVATTGVWESLERAGEILGTLRYLSASSYPEMSYHFYQLPEGIAVLAFQSHLGLQLLEPERSWRWRQGAQGELMAMHSPVGRLAQPERADFSIADLAPLVASTEARLAARFLASRSRREERIRSELEMIQQKHGSVMAGRYMVYRPAPLPPSPWDRKALRQVMTRALKAAVDEDLKEAIEELVLMQNLAIRRPDIV